MNEQPCTRLGCWMRDNSSSVILIIIVMLFMAYTLHIMHAPDVDTETLRWSREKMGESLVALIAILKASGGAKHSGDNNTIIAPEASTVNASSTETAPPQEPKP